jgi:hypothetical protein
MPCLACHLEGSLQSTVFRESIWVVKNYGKLADFNCNCNIWVCLGGDISWICNSVCKVRYFQLRILRDSVTSLELSKGQCHQFRIIIKIVYIDEHFRSFNYVPLQTDYFQFFSLTTYLTITQLPSAGELSENGNKKNILTDCILSGAVVKCLKFT